MKALFVLLLMHVLIVFALANTAAPLRPWMALVLYAETLAVFAWIAWTGDRRRAAARQLAAIIREEWGAEARAGAPRRRTGRAHVSAAPVPVAPVTPGPAPAERFDVTSCRGCGAAIIWALSSSGKRMPLDADPVTGVNGFVLEWRFDGAHLALYTSASTQPVRTSHFATCPEAARFRKTKEPKP